MVFQNIRGADLGTELLFIRAHTQNGIEEFPGHLIFLIGSDRFVAIDIEDTAAIEARLNFLYSFVANSRIRNAKFLKTFRQITMTIIKLGVSFHVGLTGKNEDINRFFGWFHRFFGGGSI